MTTESNKAENEKTVSGHLKRGVMPPCNHECETVKKRGLEECDAKSKIGYMCTLASGHDGKHVACGSHHAYEVW